MGNMLAVGIGGAIGAMGRYAVSLVPVKNTFPFLTLLTNLLGALVIGLIVGITEMNDIRESWRLFWKTGFCGGFTTFSTFSLEALQLFQTGRYVYGGLYVLLSVTLCILGVALGRYLIRYVAH